MNYIKVLFHILKNYKTDHSTIASELAALRNTQVSLRSQLDNYQRKVKELTDVSADINHRGPNTVIVTGRYRNNDYVQIFTIDDSEFSRTVDTLRNMERYGVVRRIDAMPGFRTAFLREKS